MKSKLTKLSVCALSAAALCGCSQKTEAPIMTDVPTDAPVETLMPEELTIVNGTVQEVGPDYILMLTDGADGQEIVINHASLDASDSELALALKEGDHLRAAYSGVMTMSIPAQIGGAVDIDAIDKDGNVIHVETPELMPEDLVAKEDAEATVDTEAVVESEVPEETATPSESPASENSAE